jgi:hypothetical protein
MSSSVSVNVRNFNPDNVSFVVSRSKTHLSPTIYMNYGDNDKNKKNFQLVIPQSYVRLLDRTNEKSGETNYTLSYTLTGCDRYGQERADDSNDIGKLYNCLMDLEELIIKKAVEHSVDWFGKKRSEQGIREGFKKIVRLSTDKVRGEAVPNGKYDPSWLIKVPVYNGKITVDNEGIIDNRGHPVDKDESMSLVPQNLPKIFPNNCQAKLIVTGSIYVIDGGGFGVTWRLRGAQVFPSSRVKVADLFGVSETSESQPSSTTLAEEESEETAVQETEPEEAAPAPAPAPAPARKKRTAVGQ